MRRARRFAGVQVRPRDDGGAAPDNTVLVVSRNKLDIPTCLQEEPSISFYRKDRVTTDEIGDIRENFRKNQMCFFLQVFPVCCEDIVQAEIAHWIDRYRVGSNGNAKRRTGPVFGLYRNWYSRAGALDYALVPGRETF